MYKAILNIKLADPYTKIVSLSGKLHNWLVPYNGDKKLGSYLMNDSINFNRDKILSINHIYSKGTMFNSMNGELKVRTVEEKETIYDTTITHIMYFSERNYKKQVQYIHFLYAEAVSHSKSLE